MIIIIALPVHTHTHDLCYMDSYVQTQVLSSLIISETAERCKNKCELRFTSANDDLSWTNSSEPQHTSAIAQHRQERWLASQLQLKMFGCQLLLFSKKVMGGWWQTNRLCQMGGRRAVFYSEECMLLLLCLWMCMYVCTITKVRQVNNVFNIR